MEAKKNITQLDVISDFSELGKQISNKASSFNNQLNQLIPHIINQNPWFIQESIFGALDAWSNQLTKSELEQWLGHYNIDYSKEPKTIAIIMAGNIPLVGFHDLLCAVASGNKALIKPSSEDKILVKFMVDCLINLNPIWKERIEITESRIENIHSIIATGSNNSSRYFEYYFGKYPHIIRKNRNSVGILQGDESTEDLKKLGNDVFKYFGLGCRNVSKLFVPQGYKFDAFFEAIFDFKEVVNHNKYANNYEYNRAIYLMNSTKMLDNNFLLIKEDLSLSSPIGVLFYEEYSNLETLKNKILENKDKIQCVVSKKISNFKNVISFGESQNPSLMDYADGIDVMDFLNKL